MQLTHRAYENVLILAKRVKNFKHNGQAGSVLRVPDVSNLSANDMSQTGEVTSQSVTESYVDLTINKWKECSFRVNDIVKAQSKYDLRSEYTKKAGYAIAKSIETDLFALFANAAFTGYNGDGTTEATGGAAITLAGILTAQQYLLSQDVPTIDMALIVPPAARTTMMQISGFTSIDYMNKKALVNGQFGELLGMDVLVSNNCPYYTVTSSKLNAIVMQKDALALATQISPRVQTQYEQKYLSWLVTCDVLYGVIRFRTTNAIRLRLNV